MIRVFTFSQYISEDTRTVVFPLLLDIFFYPNSILHNWYRTVERISEAEIIIIPLDINYFLVNKRNRELKDLLETSKRTNKPVWVYTSGDFGKTLKYDVYSFRLGGFDSKQNKKSFILPAFIQDPYEFLLKKDFLPIEKSPCPKVGFVGHSNGTVSKYLKEFLGFAKISAANIFLKRYDFHFFFPSGYFRSKILRRVKLSKRIKTDFIERQRYRAGAKTKEEKEKTTLEFYQNIEKNPYTLCIRGRGNFSVRFYEVLAMGRIPIVVDSDQRFPLPWLPWERHCLIVKKQDVEAAIINFHNSFSSNGFRELQLENRKLWKNKLTRNGYFIEIHNYFSKMI